MLRRFGILPAVLALLISPGTSWSAENEGQADLDRATDIKLGANTIEDLNHVINLSQSAIDRGLDAANTDFAKKLLASTLLQRATLFSRAIFDQNPPDVRWNKLRQAALIDLERAVKNDNGSAEPHILIGRLHVLPGGDHKRALEAANEAVKLSGSEDQVKLRALVLRGGLQEDNEKKLADLDEAVKLGPTSAEALRARGIYYLTQEKADQALTDLDAAVKSDPKQIESHEARGLALTVLKKYDEAIVAFDKVIELTPDAALAFLHRGRARYLKKDYKEALQDLTDGLKLDSDNATLLLMRARVYQQLGEAEKARSDVESALKQQPGLGPALGLRATLAAGSGDFSQAIEDVKELRKIAPKSAELALQLGILYTANKQPRHSLPAYDEAIKLDDKSFHAYRGRGDAYLSIGKHAEAVADFEKALALRPDDPSLCNNFAWVLATSPDDKVRDGKKAKELAERACDKTEYKLGHILSTYAAAYAELGDWDNAQKFSKMAVEAGSEESQEQLSKELESYKEKKPWRELQNEPEAPDTVSTAPEKP